MSLSQGCLRGIGVKSSVLRKQGREGGVNRRREKEREEARDGRKEGGQKLQVFECGLPSVPTLGVAWSQVRDGGAEALLLEWGAGGPKLHWG